ncbi:MAG: hypothetical protein AB7F74_23505 [Parvibaculaceae bacterium]
MRQIIIRKLEDDVLKRIKARAKANGRSAEAEEAVAPPRGKQRSLSSFIGSVRGNRTQAEIDAYVRKLRDEWDY